MREDKLPPETLRELSGPALRAFFRIADVWLMGEDEQSRALGIACTATLRRWHGGDHNGFTVDILERISLILGMFKAINILLPDTARADAWVRAPNQAPLFGGRTAMMLITSGNLSDLSAVRRYLDAQLNN